MTLGAACVLLRLPFFAHELWAWDSVLYARALEQGFHVDFDPSRQRPHPPGYFLYVATAAVFRLALADSNAALVMVSALSGSLAAVAIFHLARRFAGDPAALIAAIGFALNPLVWTYSEIAYPYTTLAFGSVLVAALCHRARSAEPRALHLASVAFGLVCGFRQDLALLLGPLWLWALVSHRWRDRIVAAALVAGTSLTWLMPTIALSDGPMKYLMSLTQQADFVRRTYSMPEHGLAALLANLGMTAFALGWGLTVFTVAAAASLFADRTRTFLTLWCLPAVTFYVLVHIGEWGYTLSILPAMYVGAAIGIDQLARAVRRVPAGTWRGAATAGAIGAGLVFVLAPTPFSASAIETHDRELVARVSYVRANFEPQHTAVLAREDFLLVRYYLPEYHAWFYDPEPHRQARQRRGTANVTAIVVFTAGLSPRSDQAVRYLECGRGVRLVYLPIRPDEVLELSGELYFTTRDAGMEPIRPER